MVASVTLRPSAELFRRVQRLDRSQAPRGCTGGCPDVGRADGWVRADKSSSPTRTLCLPTFPTCACGIVRSNRRGGFRLMSNQLTSRHVNICSSLGRLQRAPLKSAAPAAKNRGVFSHEEIVSDLYGPLRNVFAGGRGRSR